jgi:putative nucleotidyltransferase with HDIG domain
MVDATRNIEEQKSKLERAVSDAETAFAESLLGAMELRGHETRAHCQRVAAYSLLIAEEMDLRGKVLQTIRYGALLHDVGKIAIPDELLVKPGPLSPDEWQIMRTHAEAGARLLAGFESLNGARVIVAQHHERWDGSGYPLGLAGDHINLGARIFAVADTLDAILSERPYRKPVTVETAVIEIARCSGTQFDPRVVEAFKKIDPSIWSQVRAQFPDDK